MGVGMPFCLLLQQFGDHVYRAFGNVAYHVGSSLTQKDGWRDVDVRLIIPDDEYERMGLGDPERTHDNKRWVSLVLAWSAFGKSLTGLPIDFQIQQRTYANSEKNKGPRSALFLVCDLHKQPDAASSRVEQTEERVSATTGNAGAKSEPPQGGNEPEPAGFRYCAHGRTPLGDWCRDCNPLRR